LFALYGTLTLVAVACASSWELRSCSVLPLKAKAELERCSRQAAAEAGQRVAADAQQQRQMLLAGFDAASKEDDAARRALQHRLDRADALATAAAEAAERADVAAAAAAAALGAAEQRALAAEAACAHLQAEASHAADAEDALRECAAELDAVRAQVDGQAAERLSLQEELRATQGAVRAEADAAGQLRGEVEPFRHEQRFRRKGGWVGRRGACNAVPPCGRVSAQACAGSPL
jgi:hypothetical protein